MKNSTNKRIIITGFVAILGIALFIAAFIISDHLNREQVTADQPIERLLTIKNIPSKEQLSQENKPVKKQKAKSKQAVKTISLSNPKDTIAPTINAPEVTVEQGTQVNVYEGVTATDNVDGDVTNKLAAINDLDTSVTGDYTVQFSVADSSGNIGSAQKLFHVVAKAAPAPVVENTTPTKEEQPAAAPATPETAYAPMTLTMNGVTIPYQNGGQGSGQSIIDSNPNGVASTWGGAAVQSGEDGLNTHFIGHNPGIFSTVFSLGVGSQIIVTDANGTPTTYTVQTLLQLDDYGDEIGTGTSYWDLTVGSGGGERITLQSCINDSTNLLVIAYK